MIDKLSELIVRICIIIMLVSILLMVREVSINVNKISEFQAQTIESMEMLDTRLEKIEHAIAQKIRL